MTEKVYEPDIVFGKALEYFGFNNLPTQVWCSKYALRNEKNELLELTPDDTHHRIANELARIESNKFAKPLSAEEIYGYLKDFRKFIFQGGILYGLGNKYSYTSLSNCIVLDQPDDSYGGICWVDQQLVQTAKRRMGSGISLDKLRPTNAPTTNSSKFSTGILSWMKRYSTSLREVGQGGRRGAGLLSLNVHHPDVETFITAKSNRDDITGVNVSIQCTEEFLSAVEKNEEYEQRWPVDSKKPTISKMVKAKDMWDLFINNSWQWAEPGVQLIDHIRKESPADCYGGYKTITGNACSELTMSALSTCILLCINLFSYVKNPFTKQAEFQYEEFYKDAQIAQRLLDDIVDLELEHLDKIIAKVKSDPEPDSVKQPELLMWQKILQICEQGRRTGNGITALGDCLAALNIKYASKKSLEVVDKIYQTLKLAAYRSSVDMAKELEPFKIWDHEKEKDNPFLLRIKDQDAKLYEDMKKYGRRNIALLTTSPAGTVSTIAGLITDKHRLFGTTSGLEPVFKCIYKRRKKGNPNEEGFRADFVDQSGDHWMEFDVIHPGAQIWKDINDKDIKESPYVEANNCDWKARVKMLGIITSHLDHNASITINLPESVDKSVVNDLYLMAWKEKCKGLTVYRENCRTGVLVDHKQSRRPKELQCEVYHVTVNSSPYFVLVGFDSENNPYEVFAGRNGALDKNCKRGKIVKKKKGVYRFEGDDGSELSPITVFATSDEEVVTRLVSTALRHKTPINFIVSQLNKAKGDLTSFAKAIARALKRYIRDGEVSDETCPSCGAKAIFQGGCVSCSCGWSKCY